MNYADLLRVSLPETALEIAALLVIVIDLVFLRRSNDARRVASAAIVGVRGCLSALALLLINGPMELRAGTDLLLSGGGITFVAQSAILALTALTLLLFVCGRFTPHPAEYVAVVLMAAIGALVLAAGEDLLIIFVGLELLSLALYVLTGFAKRSGRSAEAALKYYLFGGMAAAFLLFGFSYLYGLTGSTNLGQIYQILSQSPAGQMPLYVAALVAIAAGLGFKIAIVPFHLWAPDTYEGAPAQGAAFIASVSKVATFALLLNVIAVRVAGMQIHLQLNSHLRLAHETMAGEGFITLPAFVLIAALATVSMVVGNLAALVQTSVRRLLAYSAIAHAGYMLLGILAGLGSETASRRAAEGLLTYVITYGLTTIAAFGVVAVIERNTGSDQLDAFIGLHRRSPILAAVLLVSFLSLAGIPPLVGFWAKFDLFAAVLGAQAGVVPFALVALAVAMSAVSLYYYLQVLKRVYVMEPVDDTPLKSHPVTRTVLLLAAILIVLLGAVPGPFFNWIAASFGGF